MNTWQHNTTDDNLDLTSLVVPFYSLRKSEELLFLTHDYDPHVCLDKEKSTHKPSIVRSASSVRRPKQVHWDDGVELKVSHVNGGPLSRSSQERINSAIKRAEIAAEKAARTNRRRGASSASLGQDCQVRKTLGSACSCCNFVYT